MRHIGTGRYSSVAVRMAADGSGVYYSTDIGQSDVLSVATSVAVDQYGTADIAGHTGGLKGEPSFPISANPFGIYPTFSTSTSYYILTLTASGSAMAYYSAYTPAATSAVAVDPKLNVYLGGFGGNSALTSPAAFKSRTNSKYGTTGYVAKLVIAADLSLAGGIVSVKGASRPTNYLLPSPVRSSPIMSSCCLAIISSISLDLEISMRTTNRIICSSP
jgi:hypothetical protein